MICHVINFLFLVYITIRYGKNKKALKQSSTNQRGIDVESLERRELSRGDNVLLQTVSTINYDLGVCIYTFFILFCFVWVIIATIWGRSLPVTSPCRTTNEGEMILDTHSLLVGLLWLYLIGGALVTVFTLTVYACNEGSCIGWDTIRCFFIFLSCGQIDIAHNSQRGADMLATSKARYTANLKSYNELRRRWIFKAVNIFTNFGLGTLPKVTKDFQEKEKLRAPPSGKPQIKSLYSINHNEPSYQPRDENRMVSPHEMRLATSIGNPSYLGPEPHPLGYSPNSIQPQMPRPQAPTKAVQHVPRIKRFDQI